MQERFANGILTILFFAGVLGAVVQAQEADTETVILDTSGFWRVHHTLRTPVIESAGVTEETAFKCETPFPPADWQRSDFDDHSWHRVRGAPFPAIRSTWSPVAKWDVGGLKLNGSSSCLALICVRGKFEVTAPARVKGLTLSVAYRGGVVVRVNGTEIARGHLPKDREIAMRALAEKYPDEAYVYPDGNLLDCDYTKAPKVEDRYRLRTRRLTDVKVPASVLRKGVNVLAVEVHRAPYPAFLIEKFKRTKSHQIPSRLWDTCGIVGIRLKTQSPEGVVPNVTRPKGFQLWNSDVLAPDYDLDFGDRCEPVRPVSIMGSRGGVFSGKVVVGSDEPIRGLRVTVGVLRRGGGGGLIGPKEVEVRCALPTGSEIGANGHYSASVSRFDALAESVPEEVSVRTKKKARGNWVRPGQPKPVFGAVVPVWLTVKVPEDARPGEYDGTITVAAEHVKPVTVPVILKVNAWKVPGPREFRTFVEVIQSPDSLALYYNVPFWSERHFQLIEKSFRHLATVGNRTVYVPLICHTNLGNSQTMVRWVKEPARPEGSEADGTYTHDFTVMDRYLDLYEKHLGRPEAVCLGVWEVFLEGGMLTFARTGKWADPKNFEEFDRVKGKGPLVTGFDPSTGKVEDLQLPLYTKEEAGKRLWKPLLDGLRRRLKARGWEKRLVLGYVHDSIPAKEVVDFFQELLPGTPWMRQAHSGRKDLHGAPYALQMLVWSPKFPVYPQTTSGAGWKQDYVQFARNVRNYFPLTTFRFIGEINIMGQQRGFGRFGGDFFAVFKDSRGRLSGTVATRYPKTRWRALGISTSLLAAGKDGPLSTVRVEMMREGLQECEARIFVEETLLDENLRAKLPAPLVRRCRTILDERTLALLQGLTSHKNCGFARTSHHSWWSDPGQVGWRWYLTSGWQERSEKLFDAAGEVAKIR